MVTGLDVLTIWNRIECITPSTCVVRVHTLYVLLMMMIDVLQPPLCTSLAKWAERPPKVMRRSQRRNNLQICPPEIRTRVVVICSPTRYS